MAKPTIEDMVKLRKLGWSTHKIAKFYRLPSSAVAAVVQDSIRMIDVDKTEMPETLVHQVLRLYRAGSTMRQISEQLNIPFTTLKNWIHFSGYLKNGSVDHAYNRDDDE